MPAPVPLQPPRIFAPKLIGSTPKFTGYESERAGIYTPIQLKAFWESILGKHFTLRRIKGSSDKNF